MVSCADVDVAYLRSFARRATCENAFEFEYFDKVRCGGGDGPHRFCVFGARKLDAGAETSCKSRRLRHPARKEACLRERFDRVTVYEHLSPGVWLFVR